MGENARVFVFETALAILGALVATGYDHMLLYVPSRGLEILLGVGGVTVHVLLLWRSRGAPALAPIATCPL
eukprot:882827-Lingulodinium_polyedra.AAC.1